MKQAYFKNMKRISNKFNFPPIGIRKRTKDLKIRKKNKIIKIRIEIKNRNTNKMDNQEKMDKFLKMYTLQRLKQKQIDNMNRPITSIRQKQNKTAKKQNFRTRWLYRGILSKILKKVNAYLSPTTPEI